MCSTQTFVNYVTYFCRITLASVPIRSGERALTTNITRIRLEMKLPTWKTLRCVVLRSASSSLNAQLSLRPGAAATSASRPEQLVHVGLLHISMYSPVLCNDAVINVRVGGFQVRTAIVITRRLRGGHVMSANAALTQYTWWPKMNFG